jgi:hypothetical protein
MLSDVGNYSGGLLRVAEHRWGIEETDARRRSRGPESGKQMVFVS